MSTNKNKARQFAANLQKAIDWYRENTNDPHGTSNAVLCSLTEVRVAFMSAYGGFKAARRTRSRTH